MRLQEFALEQAGLHRLIIRNLEEQMATIPSVHANLNPLQLILNMATGIPDDPSINRPRAIIGTATGEISGWLIGYSLTPKEGNTSATLDNYGQAFFYMNTAPAGGHQAIIDASHICYIKFQI
jgi:hypothetical protein